MRRNSSSQAPHPRGKRIVDRTAVATFACVWSVAGVRFASDLIAQGAWQAGFGLVCGYLLADFVAGSVHWIADRHFDPATPALGPMLIEPFRAHHDDPLSITRHDFFEVLGNNALVTIPAVVLLLCVPAPDDAATRWLVATALSGTLFAVATNLFHAWAHDPAPPRIARRLHRLGLILTPARHARHHRGAHDRAYCVTSGWLNPLLDALQFWARLDAWIASLRSEPARERTAPR